MNEINGISFFFLSFVSLSSSSQAYSEHCQTSKLELCSLIYLVGAFAKITDVFQPLTIFAENFVGNKAKGLISKRVFQKTKHGKFSEKRTFFTPWYAHAIFVCVRTRNVRFSENLACFVSLKHPFWDSPFYLITDDLSFDVWQSSDCACRDYTAWKNTEFFLVIIFPHLDWIVRIRENTDQKKLSIWALFTQCYDKEISDRKKLFSSSLLLLLKWC